MAPTLQTTLIVTERCTLRCRYCVYGGTYDYSRSHGSGDMPVEVALKAVEYLAERHRERERHNPGRNVALGFYGGEPLLRIDLIRQAVAHASRIGLQCLFTVTTNGTIDDDDVVDFLVANDFSVAVSLDGPPGEHDRNRVFPDGKGSFGHAYGFLAKLREARRRHGKQGPGSIPYLVLGCQDKGTDLSEVRRFFDDHSEVFSEATIRTTPIIPYRTSYYDGWPPERLDIAKRTARVLWRDYVAAMADPPEKARAGYLWSLFGASFQIVLQALGTEAGPIRASCVPGTRIAVDPHGRFHVCERVNNNYPIGDLERGLDGRFIAELLSQLQSYFQKRCASCDVTRLCGVCLSHVMLDGPMALAAPDQLCEQAREGSRANLSLLWGLLEKHPSSLKAFQRSPRQMELDRVFET